jgi:hypothetical protein
MPTVVTKTIAATSSPTTPDYTTIQAWEDAITADLVAADEQWVGECLDQGEFTPSASISIAGQTTDATRNVVLKCAAGDSFSDNASVRSNALFYSSSNGVAVSNSAIFSSLDISTAYTLVQGLQIKHNANYDTVVKFRDTAVQAVVDSCILEHTSGALGDLVTAGNTGSLANAPKLINCLGVTNKSGVNGGAALKVYGCTIVRTGSAGGTGLTSPYSKLLIQNSAVFNFSTLVSGTLEGTSDYNATDDATGFGVGSNNVTSLTYSDQFENTASDFRAKSTGGLQAGNPDSTNLPDDISGETRSATTPWIGCWEVAAAAGGAKPIAAYMKTSQIIGGGLL